MGCDNMYKVTLREKLGKGLCASGVLIALTGYYKNPPWLYTSTPKLITSGIYQYTRHPIYLGFACADLGLLLHSFNSPPIVLFGLYVLHFVHRKAIKEEGILREKFGTEYEKYEQT